MLETLTTLLGIAPKPAVQAKAALGAKASVAEDFAKVLADMRGPVAGLELEAEGDAALEDGLEADATELVAEDDASEEVAADAPSEIDEGGELDPLAVDSATQDDPDQVFAADADDLPPRPEVRPQENEALQGEVRQSGVEVTASVMEAAQRDRPQPKPLAESVPKATPETAVHNIRQDQAPQRRDLAAETPRAVDAPAVPSRGTDSQRSPELAHQSAPRAASADTGGASRRSTVSEEGEQIVFSSRRRSLPAAPKQSAPVDSTPVMVRRAAVRVAEISGSEAQAVAEKTVATASPTEREMPVEFAARRLALWQTARAQGAPDVKVAEVARPVVDPVPVRHPVDRMPAALPATPTPEVAVGLVATAGARTAVETRVTQRADQARQDRGMPDMSVAQITSTSDANKAAGAVTVPQQPTPLANAVTAPGLAVPLPSDPRPVDVKEVSAPPFVDALEARGSVSGQAVSASAQVAAPRAEAGAILRQVSEAMVRGGNGDSLEIQLRPEELGGVKMKMVTTEMGMTVHITADRPETLDLLRRHVDQLAQQLSDAGRPAQGFTFGDGGQAGRQGAQRDGGANLLQTTEDSSVDPASAPPDVEVDGDQGVDIRI